MQEKQNQENKETEEFRQAAEKVQKKNIQPMIKYSFELKKIGLVDGLRQIVKNKLVNDREI
jgi:hypothetical protein